MHTCATGWRLAFGTEGLSERSLLDRLHDRLQEYRVLIFDVRLRTKRKLAGEGGNGTR